MNLHVVTIKEEPLTPLHGGDVSLLATASKSAPALSYFGGGCCRDMANRRSRHQHVVPNLNEVGPKTLIAEMPMSGDDTREMIFKALNSSSRFPAQSEYYRIVPQSSISQRGETDPTGAQATE
ncbi:MAG TPA: hypothetical protein VIK39_07400 [Candidatus Angelobacter sp.]